MPMKNFNSRPAGAQGVPSLKPPGWKAVAIASTAALLVLAAVFLVFALFVAWRYYPLLKPLLQ